MTETNILTAAQRIVDASEKATEGPWIDVPELGKVLTVLGETPCTIVDCDANSDPDDIQFIVTARNDAPRVAKALIDIVNALQFYADESNWVDINDAWDHPISVLRSAGGNEPWAIARDTLAKLEGDGASGDSPKTGRVVTTVTGHAHTVERKVRREGDGDELV